MEIDYKEKYLKYKKKYIDLKNIETKLKQFQTGGLGQTTSWIKDDTFSDFNKHNKSFIGINEDVSTDFKIYNIYKNDLSKLLIRSNKEINLDFIGLFHSKIFIDNKDEFNARTSVIRDRDRDRDKHILKLTENWKYRQIDRTPVIITSNSSIFFIENKVNENLKYVLKVYIGSNENKSINLSLEDIKDYLSLQIVRLIDKSETWDFQSKNVLFERTIFKDRFNYNDYDIDTEFMKTNYFNNIVPLYLSTYNSNAINDLIINLILQKLNEDGIIANNYVKYHHMFITKYNDKSTYFVIMDHLDGSIDNLFKHTRYIEKNKDLLKYMFHTIETMCKPLKEKPYLFTHTDMKMENVFYKIFEVVPENSINGIDDKGLKNFTREELKNKLIVYEIIVDSGTKFIAFYLADYDKSSITYNNIRFYNEPKIIGTESSVWKILQDRRIYSSNTTVNVHTDTKLYKITRLLGDSQAMMAIANMESEELYLRYSFFPYHVNFDYISLLISLSIHMNTDHMKTLEDFSKNYILNYEKFYEFYFKYRWGGTKDKYGGDFGLMLSPLFSDKENDIIVQTYFLQKINKNVCKPVINKIYTSPKMNKLCLSMPFISSRVKAGNVVANQGIGKLIFNGLVEGFKTTFTNYSSNNISINLNIDSTDELYKLYKLNDKNYKDYLHEDVKIEYTGDNIHTNNLLVVKTNKYSHISKLYEYDDFDENDMKKIIKFHDTDVSQLKSLEEIDYHDIDLADNIDLVDDDDDDQPFYSIIDINTLNNPK